MTIQELITLYENKLQALAAQRDSAVILGDVEQVLGVDADAASTQALINQLRTIPE